MANLKNITELPVVESADGLNLIVNDNGSAKQIAASAVGAQADWNVTDETNPAFVKNKPEIAQADWAETDETSMAFIKNKPVEEFDLDITTNISLNSDGDVLFSSTLNAGTFDMVKSKILQNEHIKIKVRFIVPAYENNSINGIEIYLINSVSYVPENYFGDGSPETISFMYTSLVVDDTIWTNVYFDNVVESGSL